MTLTHTTSPPPVPIARVPPERPIGAPAVRLSLEPNSRRARAVDGEWWPRSTDAAAELPGLIAAVDRHLGRMTLRVGLHVDAWSNIPRRIPVPGRAVKVGWFQSMDRRLVTLTINGREGITLRVIPPEAAASAKAAFASATTEPHSVPPVENRTPVPVVRSRQGAEQDVWENEGGHFTIG
ncbi:DUF5994 family protein [Microbispora sp. NBC_01189]|uniref:DUF5994 family protein n=1 Tax=Microbispora sp. NBC_01189 TaxID=2903583 RepID=UPI002E106148|nr:DUF5994 family protein [Microbispora sp. NBC_01189]